MVLEVGRKPNWKKEMEKPFPRYDRERLTADWFFEHTHQTQKPVGELEALMMTAPGQHDPILHDKCVDDPYRQLDETLGVKMELSDDERRVLDATVISGLSFREAAAVLGMAPSTVHRIHTSAIKRMRERFGWATDE